MEPSAVSSLVSASTHSIIRAVPSDCSHSSLHHLAQAELLQLALQADERKTTEPFIPEEFMEKAAITTQTTQMDMCYLNVDNRLCTDSTYCLWAQVTLL